MGIPFEYLYYIDIYYDDIDNKLIENCFVEYFFYHPHSKWVSLM